jgi:thioredoxin 1
MSSANTVELNDTNFDEAISKPGSTVLVDFWAEWCGPCKMIAPLLDQIADSNVGKVKICKVNVDKHPALAARFNISSIPTLLIYKDGKQSDTVVGMTSRAVLEQKLGLAS